MELEHEGLLVSAIATVELVMCPKQWRIAAVDRLVVGALGTSEVRTVLCHHSRTVALGILDRFVAVLHGPEELAAGFICDVEGILNGERRSLAIDSYLGILLGIGKVARLSNAGLDRFITLAIEPTTGQISLGKQEVGSTLVGTGRSSGTIVEKSRTVDYRLKVGDDEVVALLQ